MNFFPYICHRRKVPDDLLIPLNPEEDSTLPYLVRIPLGPAGFTITKVLKTTWTRTSKPSTVTELPAGRITPKLSSDPRTPLHAPRCRH
jgi:hypothetical protein